MSRHRIEATLRITAHAPGHKFRCEGRGFTGELELVDGSLTRLEARGALRLDAGDPLGNHELRKFLGGEPEATASLRAPARIGEPARVELAIGARRAEIAVRFTGAPPAGRASFVLRFSALGFTPPKLLFMKVKDELEVEVEARLTPLDV